MTFRTCSYSVLAAIALTVQPGPAMAYIGPGVGLGALAVAVALIVGFALLIVGLIWFPLKRRLKHRQNRTTGHDTDPTSE